MFSGTVSSSAGLRALSKKYGAAALILVLNATAAVYLIGTLIYGIAGLFPDGAALSDISTDMGYLVFMIYNEVAAYAVPLLSFLLIFRRELKESSDPGNFLPSNSYKYVFGSSVLLFLTGWLLATGGGMLTEFLSDFFHTLAGTPEVKTAFSGSMPQNAFRYTVFEVCTCLIAPICEELLYRHILLKPLQKYSDTAAVIVTALLFSLSHFNFDQFLYTLAFGIFLAVIAARSGSVILPTVFHIFNNMLAGIGTYLPETFGDEAVDAFFASVKSINGTFSAVMLFAGFAAAAASVLMGLLRLHNNCNIPVNKQLGTIFSTPAVIISAVLCLALTVFKLYL